MSFFIDTNIPIGYTVPHDKWHVFAKSFLEDHAHDSIFWSNLVKQEYTKTLNNIIDEVNIFLNYCKYILKTNECDFNNNSDFENFIIKKTKNCSLDKIKKYKILEHFWNKYSFTECESNVLYSKFLDFSHDFQELYFKRDIQLNTIINLHDCGLNNYLKYLDYAKKLYNWGVHKPDCKIITDAHDCGIKNKKLNFISTDEKLLTILLKHDTTFLNIEFKSYN